ncbi:DUF305 domain-containing protein [Psychrobacter sp. 1Y11]|uniref:DUF305 domain-containing protein n=1 Tax=Psychrobacter sp. 1Y11 TaxID=3457446 RepID=UPI003FD50F90
MILSSRFSASLISVVVGFALSACQPASDPSETTAETTDTPIVTQNSATQDDTDEVIVVDETDESMVNSEQMTEDYTKAMTRMNNEIMIGIVYNDPDTAFAKTILALHRGAISMAELQLKYGTDNELKLLAQEIIKSQQQKIDISNKWLASHPDIPNPKPNTEAMQLDYADIVASMNYNIRMGTESPAADLAFARGMLAHQQAILQLAQVQLRYGTDVEMRRLAVQITRDQPRIIQILEDWLANNAPVPESVESLEPEEHGDTIKHDEQE